MAKKLYFSISREDFYSSTVKLGIISHYLINLIKYLRILGSAKEEYKLTIKSNPNETISMIKYLFISSLKSTVFLLKTEYIILIEKEIEYIVKIMQIKSPIISAGKEYNNANIKPFNLKLANILPIVKPNIKHLEKYIIIIIGRPIIEIPSTHIINVFNISVIKLFLNDTK